MTLIATAGVADANAFCDVDAALAYLETRPNAGAFTELTDDEQEQCLIEATRELSRLSYVGTRATTTQALAFPRVGVVKHDDPEGTEYADDAIPAFLVQATIELAIEVARLGGTDVSAMPDSAGVIRKKLGPIETQWASPFYRPVGLARFPRVLALIEPYLDSASVGVVRVARQ